MSNIINPSAGLRSRGAYVLPVTFSFDRQPFAELAGAYAQINSMADALVAKKAELEGDKLLSSHGRNEAYKAFLRSVGADTLKRATGALEKATDAAEEISASMSLVGVDKADIGAAMVRSEIRTHLRGLTIEARTAMLLMGDVDATTQAAILEAPAALSGLTPDQHRRLTHDAIAAQHPEKAQQMVDIDNAGGVLKVAISAATGLMLDGGQIAPHDLDKVVGGRRKVTEIARDGQTMPLPQAAE